jgi:hypothetical protein
MASRKTATTAGSLTSRTSWIPNARQHLRQRRAVAQRRHLGGRLQSLGALPDACDQHLLFVAHQRVELSLRHPGARGDLEGAGRRVALLLECLECRVCRVEDTVAHRGFVGAVLCP